MDEDVFVNEFSEAAQILYDLFEDKFDLRKNNFKHITFKES